MEEAIKVLHQGEYSIVVQNETQQFTSKKRGIAPILELIDEKRDLLNNALVADKVIGKAAALLLIYGNVKAIHADIISEHAIEVLNQSQVAFTYDKSVPYIINRTKTDMCPMERCVLEINDPKQALDALKRKLEEMRA